MLFLHDWRPDLQLKPSTVLAAGSSGFCGVLVLASLLFWDAHDFWRWFVVACLLGAWAHTFYRYVQLKSNKSVRRVLWCADGWMVECGGGLMGPYVLGKASRVARGGVLFHFCSPAKFLAVIYPGVFVPVWRDSIDQEDFHRLQLFLRWQKTKIVNPALFVSGEE